MPVRLPLLPLTSVLVPGLVLPLHVFEERYRVLVNALLALPDEATRQFGVITIRAGVEAGQARPELYEVGCTAELREVTPYSDGRFDIVSVGENRFRLVDIDESAETPYLTGLVELLPEPDGSDDVTLLRRAVVDRFADYRRALRVEVTELPEDARVVSYLVAAAMVLDLPERQRLLEQPTTALRLRSEIDLLRRERSLLKAFEALPAVELLRSETGAN